LLQILGLREKFNSKLGIRRPSEDFFAKGWRAMDLRTMFASLPDVLAQIPEDQRWNLFYTMHHVFEEPGRRMERMEAYAFDIDQIPGFSGTRDQVREIAGVVARTLGLPLEELGVVCSGNGVHVLVYLDPSCWQTSPEYFEKNRGHYRAVCDNINRALDVAGYGGAKADPAIFDQARILRLPGTLNRKTKEGQLRERNCYLLQGDLKPQKIDISELSGIPEVSPEDAIPEAQMARFPEPDPEGVLGGCSFLKECKALPKTVTEPNWYAMLSIIGRLPNGRELAHEYSKGHPNYTPQETEAKLDQAMAQAGPRTCQNVQDLWGKCKQCPYYGKIPSPIVIKGENYIATEKTGFHHMTTGQDGRPKPGKADWDGLRKFFQRKHPYATLADGEYLVTWTGTHWQEYSKVEAKAFAQKHFRPVADTNKANEFLGILLRNEVRPRGWTQHGTKGKLNFLNGTLEPRTMSFGPHNRDDGFMNVIPYAYDPKAAAPRFEKFLDDVTCGHRELREILLQYIGYSLSNDAIWEQKCLILQGEGRNGKSTLMQVVRELAGEGNSASLTLTELEKDTNRFSLDGAFFNMAEEAPTRGMLESGIFKTLIGGGSFQVKKLYSQPYSIQNRAKLWLACNDMPRFNDFTVGMFRRLVIVPFQAKFEGANVDKNIGAKLSEELPGIFNLAMAAYGRMRANGGLLDSQLVQEQADMYRLEQDSVYNWWQDNVEVVPMSETAPRVDSSKLFQEYAMHMRQSEEKPLSAQQFQKRVRTFVKDIEARRVRSNGVRWLIGISLLTRRMENF